MMSRKPTIQDVAREAGTSVSTVSRVLTGSAHVSPDRRRAVEAAVARLGFRPSHIARSLRTRSTRTIGLLINDITNPFYSAVVKGAEDEANRRGYGLILCDTNEDPAREQQYLEMLRDKQVDGIIFGPTGSNTALIAPLARRLPLVMIDRRLDEVDADAVLADNEGGAYRAASHLLAHGHRRIGAVTWGGWITSLEQRLRGYRRALTDGGAVADPRLVVEVPRPEAELVSRAICGWLRADWEPAGGPPTALFALNNQMGMGALRAARELGLCIPGDLALVVFDDLEMFELTTPAITAVSQPAADMGRRAVELLVARLADRAAGGEGRAARPPEVALLPTRLVERGSV